jgi:hypothetical protein
MIEIVLVGGLVPPGRASYPFSVQSGQSSYRTGVTRTWSSSVGSRSASVKACSYSWSQIVER